MTDPIDELPPEQQQLLRDLVVGDDDGASPAAAAAMADAAFRAAFDRLRRTQHVLDEAGTTAAVPAVGDTQWRVPDRLVRATIAKLAGVPETVLSPTPARPRRRFLIAALAVAAALLAILWLWRRDGDGGRDDRSLGSVQLELLEPHATGSGGLELSWRCSIAGATFSAFVYDPDRPEEPPIVSLEPTSNTSWILDLNTVKSLRSGLHWRVVAEVHGRIIDADRRLR